MREKKGALASVRRRSVYTRDTARAGRGGPLGARHRGSWRSCGLSRPCGCGSWLCSAASPSRVGLIVDCLHVPHA